MNWDNELREKGILWKYSGRGAHAALSLTDKHSDLYFNSDYLVCNPPLLREACSALFKTSTKTIKHRPDWIITYPPFGLTLGFCLAELYEAKFGYIKSLQEPKIQFDLQRAETVLLCADDLISGTSICKVLKAIETKGAKAMEPITAVANFSGESKFQGMEVVSLVSAKMNMWSANNCPLCASGSPVISARDNWQKLVGAKI